MKSEKLEMINEKKAVRRMTGNRFVRFAIAAALIVMLPVAAMAQVTQRTTTLDLTLTSVGSAGGAAGNPASANIDGSSEGWMWYYNGATGVDGEDYSGKVLVLDGIDITTSSPNGIQLPTATDVTIVLKDGSDNSIISTSSGIRGTEAITISGGGALEVVSSGSDGIIATTGGITINGGMIKITGTTYGLRAQASGPVTINGGAVESTASNASGSGYGIYTGGSLTITAGTLTASGIGTGISYGSLSITGGTVTASGGVSAFGSSYTVPTGYAYYVSGTANTPSADKLTGNGSNTYILTSQKWAKVVFVATTTLYFGEDSGGNWNLYTNSAKTTAYTGNAGNWTAAANKLTLNNFSFTTTSATALSIDGGNEIVLTGVNTIAVSGSPAGASNGITLTGTGALTISGSGQLTVTAGNPATGNVRPSYGINVGSGSLIINDATVTANGGTTAGVSCPSYGIYLYSSSNDTVLTINNATVTANGGTPGSGNGSAGIYSSVSSSSYASAAVTINDSTVTATGSNTDGAAVMEFICTMGVLLYSIAVL